jgi:L-rhamnose isomerase
MSRFLVSYMIIYIPTKTSSNEIESLLVVFIPLQLILGRIVECSLDHICLLDDLPNSTTLTQEIVASSVFSVTKILVIENHQLDSTFLHVAFRSQRLLKSIGDQTGSDTT